MSPADSEPVSPVKEQHASPGPTLSADAPVTLCLCGDVMVGRGIDQILPHPSDPALHEPSMGSALGYVELAEHVNGPIPRAVPYEYIWGDAMGELKRVARGLRIINLETAVTRSDAFAQYKEVHYRLNPANVHCLSAAHIDSCNLANNHVLDWGENGLKETLKTLRDAGIKTAGAGRTLREAQAPAVFDLPAGGRVLLFAFGSVSSGIPSTWAATDKNAGVNLLDETSSTAALEVQVLVEHVKQKGDLIVASIHWGSNWGYEIPEKQRSLAHELIDHAGVDVVFGHSSHHVKGLEIYRGKLILYGCGDLLTDYEGIRGYDWFRGDLGLMYFVRLDRSSGKLVGVHLTPTTMRRFQVKRASKSETRWLLDVLNREGQPFGNRVQSDQFGRLIVQWD